MTGPIQKLSTFTLSSLLIGSTALLVAACNDGGSGNDSTNDAGVTPDAEVDAGQVDASPWTYECPTDQPADHFCFRGQVLDLIDDQPVEVLAGAVMQQLVPAEEGGYPTVLNDETEVQPDGRFIFRSSPAVLLADPPRDSDPPVASCTHGMLYLQFELELYASISGAAYTIPENKYG